MAIGGVKMKRTEFNELITYLKNRPEEARRLREVLGTDSLKILAPVWLTAKQAGESINKSASWIRKHMDLFPGAVKVQRGQRFAWMFRRDEVRTQYNVWIFNNNK